MRLASPQSFSARRPPASAVLVAVASAALLAATTSPSSVFASAASSHVVSGTSARLPMSLSSVITDLEAEGASYVTTAAFLTSKSVRKARASTLVRTLFGISGDGAHDGEVEYGVTTAFGKKIADGDAEGGNDGGDDSDEDGGAGVAVACPTCASPRRGASASEVSSTVVACGGTVVYVADAVDLGRGEGLFDYLGPALERLLAFRANRAKADDADGDGDGAEGWKSRPSSLIVVFDGVDGAKGKMEEARRQWEAAASQMLESIIQPSSPGSPRAARLEDIFDRIECLSSSEKNVDVHLCPAGGRVSAPGSPSSRDPAEVASGVSDVVNAGLVEDLGPIVEMTAPVPVKQACPRLARPVDLAAARLLGPLARKALSECLDVVRDVTGDDGRTLAPDFGALCDAAIRRAVSDFDERASGARFRKSPVAKRLRADLVENLYRETGDVYELQASALRDASFAAFRGRLNKLRIGPKLPEQMDEAARESLAEFAAAVKKLRTARASSRGSWTTNADQISSLRSRMAEHNAERLKAARASGQFKPLPRKGVTVGLHWLLPKPFGNDYRQEPSLTHAADDLVYAPADGITDVSGSEIKTGDWRRSVVPVPSGSEMMYLK
ncbi:hypothetical protein ACHAWF_013315 [Thalassiosira exigua]